MAHRRHSIGPAAFLFGHDLLPKTGFHFLGPWSENAKSRAGLVPAGRGFCRSNNPERYARPENRSPSLSVAQMGCIRPAAFLSLLVRPSCAALFLPVRPSSRGLEASLSVTSVHDEFR
ncbi:hypothetical protein X737_21610 [Mesorhizobium sp. L48C026A00]|nr:hypothetical protein X737_21610 [Mesorhizobium sp. L48C026A00]